jgi:hypothetical protein
LTLARARPLKLPTKSARERAQSKALWNEARLPERADFYTIGYEGRATKDLFGALTGANVQCVLDIRFNPDVSPRYEQGIGPHFRDYCWAVLSAPDGGRGLVRSMRPN